MTTESTMKYHHKDPARTTTTTKFKSGGGGSIKSKSKSTGTNTNPAATKTTSKSLKKATPTPTPAPRLAASPEVDIETDRWPYCIVWTPLPVVTWLVPIIGHTGVANSKGIIYDFNDDYNVSVDNFSFGTPTKYYQFRAELIPSGGSEAWDKAIKETSDYYSRTRHSLFFNNCHQYIAGVLNKVKYSNRNDWTQTEVWWKITFCSTYTGFLGFIRQWWPFSVIIIAVIVFCCLAF